MVGTLLGIGLLGLLSAPATSSRARMWRQRRRAAATAVQRSRLMGDFAASVARRLSGGDTLLQSLAGSARAAPFAQPIAQLVAEHERGVTLSRAAQRWHAREPTSEVGLLTAAIVVSADTVGARPELFDHVARTLRANSQLVAEARVHVSSARASMWVVAALPWTVALGVVGEGGAAARVLTSTPIGWFCIAAGIVLETTGIWIMRRLIAKAVP